MLETIIVAGVMIAMFGMYVAHLYRAIDELRKNNNKLKKENKILKLRLR
jgi:hypothetical protein